MIDRFFVLLDQITLPWWAWLVLLIAMGKLGARLGKTLVNAGRRRETLWERHDKYWWRAALATTGRLMVGGSWTGGFALFLWVVAFGSASVMRLPFEVQPSTFVVPAAMVLPALFMAFGALDVAGRLGLRRAAPRRHGHQLTLKWAQLREPDDARRQRVQSALDLAHLAVGRTTGVSVLSWDPPGGGLNAALVSAHWAQSAPLDVPRLDLPASAVAVSEGLLERLDTESLAAVIVALVKASEAASRPDQAWVDQATVLAMHDPVPLLAALDAVMSDPAPCSPAVAEMVLQYRPEQMAVWTIDPEQVGTSVVWFATRTTRVELLDRADGLRSATHSMI